MKVAVRFEPLGRVNVGEEGGEAEGAATATVGPITVKKSVDDCARGARRYQVGEDRWIAGQKGTNCRLGPNAGAGQTLKCQETAGNRWRSGGNDLSNGVTVGLNGEANDDTAAKELEKVKVALDKW